MSTFKLISESMDSETRCRPAPYGTRGGHATRAAAARARAEAAVVCERRLQPMQREAGCITRWRLQRAVVRGGGCSGRKPLQWLKAWTAETVYTR